MDAVLCLREATHFQSMELERPEGICGLESSTRSRLWSARGHCACRQEVTLFGLRLARTEIASSSALIRLGREGARPKQHLLVLAQDLIGLWQRVLHPFNGITTSLAALPRLSSTHTMIIVTRQSLTNPSSADERG